MYNTGMQNETDYTSELRGHTSRPWEENVFAQDTRMLFGVLNRYWGGGAINGNQYENKNYMS